MFKRRKKQPEPDELEQAAEAIARALEDAIHQMAPPRMTEEEIVARNDEEAEKTQVSLNDWAERVTEHVQADMALNGGYLARMIAAQYELYWAAHRTLTPVELDAHAEVEKARWQNAGIDVESVMPICTSYAEFNFQRYQGTGMTLLEILGSSMAEFFLYGVLAGREVAA